MSPKQTRFRGPNATRLFVDELKRNGVGNPEMATLPNRFSYEDRFLYNKIVRRLPDGSELNYLEAACGPRQFGSVTAMQARKTLGRQRQGKGVRINVVATDLRMPPNLAGQIKHGIAYRKEDLLKRVLSHERERYDLVRATNVTIHLEPEEERIAIQRLGERLREGGLLITECAGPMHGIFQKIDGELRLVYTLPIAAPPKLVKRMGIEEDPLQKADFLEKRALMNRLVYPVYRPFPNKKSQLAGILAYFKKHHPTERQPRKPILLPAPK